MPCLSLLLQVSFMGSLMSQQAAESVSITQVHRPEARRRCRSRGQLCVSRLCFRRIPRPAQVRSVVDENCPLAHHRLLQARPEMHAKSVDKTQRTTERVTVWRTWSGEMEGRWTGRREQPRSVGGGGKSNEWFGGLIAQKARKSNGRPPQSIGPHLRKP